MAAVQAIALEDLEHRLAEERAVSEERARRAELATAEWHRLADEVAALQAALAAAYRPAPPPSLPTPHTLFRLTQGPDKRLRCPRCGGRMTEYQHALVRADKCDDCFGIFFDNGELELVIAKTIEDRDEQFAQWGNLFRRS